MENRKYISEQYQYNQAKIPFAVNVKADKTSLHTIERFNGPWKYDGDRGEQIIFTITFEDFKLSCTSKARDTFYTDSEWLYTKYALAAMEMCDTYEEYYKAALLISKNNFKRTIASYEKAKEEFEKTGYWPYPYYLDEKMYKRSYELDKKIFASIDITEDDLSFFKQFKKSFESR